MTTTTPFSGPSEMHARTGAHDWAGTPLGPVERWPQSLRTTVRTLLSSRYPMVLTWGPEYVQFYNDAYAALIGDKHPAALGQDIRVTLAESWGILGPMIERVMATGVPNWTPALQLLLERAGYREEAYFSVSHAPAEDDAGRIVGMLAVCSEVTEQVIGERRLRLLRDLASRAGEVRGVERVCHDLADAITGHALDLPFALLYLRDDDGRSLRLCGAVGVEPAHPAAPRVVAPGAADAGPWPLARAAAGETVLADDVERHLPLGAGAWGDPARQALVMPIAAASGQAPHGVLVAGLSPSRALDEGYASFLELLAGQVSIAIRNARAYEEERRRAEALAEIDRAKTAFFSNVSHEFRTPLTLMLGPLEDALRQGAGLPTALAGSLETAQRNALRLLRLVNTLLDFSRVEAGRARAEYAPTDLAAFTAELASSFRSACERAGLRLVVDCPPLPAPLYVDRDLWERVVLNLVSNAFKHTFAGEIAVVLRPTDDGGATLQVRDTGVGIAPDEIPHLFDRFHRVRGARSRTHEGSGIGLALVREAVRLHGGEVTAQSEVDRGTTFTLTLPGGWAHLPADRVRADASAAPSAREARAFVEEALRWLPGADSPASPSRGAGGEGPARILLADDNADMRAYVSRLLRERGWEVEAVADGQSALEAARARPPALVLSDVMMPGLDGFALVRALRAEAETATIPILLLSAYAGEEPRVEGLGAGADDYLVKPFSARELLARVAANLELSRMRREAAARERRLHALEAAGAARSQFLSTMSHELRTPLNAIAGYVELMEMGIGGELGEVQLGHLERIRSAQRHLLRMVEDVLDLARVESGKAELEATEIPLPGLLAQVEAEVAPRLSEGGLRYEAACDDATLAARADARRARQILLNLLSNAARFTPQGGRVRVTCDGSGGIVSVHVADTGVGIAEGERESVFLPFVQPGRTLSRPVEGTGLGLALSRELARAMGGDLTLRSSEPGQGSVFTLTLPRAGRLTSATAVGC